MNLAILISLIKPSLLASTINSFKPSTINRNRKENNGQPFLSPLKALKNPQGEPFIRITKEVDYRHHTIQFTVCKFILVYKRTSVRCIQFTLS